MFDQLAHTTVKGPHHCGPLRRGANRRRWDNGEEWSIRSSQCEMVMMVTTVRWDDGDQCEVG